MRASKSTCAALIFIPGERVRDGISAGRRDVCAGGDSHSPLFHRALAHLHFQSSALSDDEHNRRSVRRDNANPLARGGRWPATCGIAARWRDGLQPAARWKEGLPVRAPEPAHAGLAVGVLRQLNGLTTAIRRGRPHVVDAAIVIRPPHVSAVRCPLMTARMFDANEVVDGEFRRGFRLRARQGRADREDCCRRGKPA
jgi:hypothetical protein